MMEHGTLHIPDIRAQNDIPLVGSVAEVARFWPFPFAYRGNLLDS